MVGLQTVSYITKSKKEKKKGNDRLTTMTDLKAWRSVKFQLQKQVTTYFSPNSVSQPVQS